MQFVLCSDETYEELYAGEYYKYPRVLEWTTLLGFMGTEGKGVTVLFHTDELATAIDEGVEDDIEVRLETLADIRYINLIHVDEDGMQNRHYPPAEKPEGGKL